MTSLHEIFSKNVFIYLLFFILSAECWYLMESVVKPLLLVYIYTYIYREIDRQI